MSTASPTLADLRRRIDELDTALHDVLIARAGVVEAIAKLKQQEATPPLRPGREAQIIRRLLERHRGAFPRPVLVRLWREILAGTIAIQVDLQIAVYQPSGMGGLWDLARDHYGSQTAMTGFHSIGEVLRAITTGRALLGVLPVPAPGEEPWWRFLGAGDAAALRIIARLPFGARGNARGDGGDAFVLGAVAPEESGADRSLYVIETGEDVSRTRLQGALAAVGAPASVIAAIDAEGGGTAQLVELDGWIAGEDARIREALSGLGDRALRLAWLGAYARPLTPAEIGAR